MLKTNITILLLTFFFNQFNAWSCTIFCAIDKHGHLWAGNNEDGHFSLGTKTNVVTKTDSTLGFIWYSYERTRYAQGGINEAGLFYDLNAVHPSDIKDADKKILFPGENLEDFYLYLLGHCKTVPEVFELYSKYKMPWMKEAQMNVADKQGNMGIVTADSAWLVHGNYSISTNYNLCHPDKDNKTSWRYPLAEEILRESEPNFVTFTRACEATSQRKITNTIFSSICNLNTGELWFYYAWDYENPYKTSIQELLSMGDTVLMTRDWFPDRTLVKAYQAYVNKDFSAALAVLNTIKDSERREDMLKLLAIEMITGSTRERGDNPLVTEMIEASNHIELLRWFMDLKITQENKDLAESKIISVQFASILDSNLFWVLILGGMFTIAIIILKKRKTRNGS
jgi:hypothetical protein